MADTTTPTLHTRLVNLLKASEALRCTAPVDDDFPEMMHNHDSAMRAAREALDQAGGVVPFDLVAHLHRQREFSERTFGPGARTAGVLDHIRKELAEVEASPGDVTEWVDLVILALDGAWRAGHQPQAIVDALVAKQERNEGRTWPDWRTADPSKAIEHDRTGEVTGDGTGQALPPLRPDSTPEEVTAYFNAEDAARAARNDEAMVDASDDPAAMSAALVELAKALGADCELDDMLHAIDKLQRDAEDVDGLRDQLELVRARETEIMRTLWLVVRIAGGPHGVIIDLASIARADWTRCALRREEQLASGGIRLEAIDNAGRGAPGRVPARLPIEAMHQQLLDMLGATDHQGAAARIGELAGLELLLTTGGAGRGVTTIAQERRRQIEGERFDPTADQQYDQGELARAAACYVRLEAMRSVAATVPGTAVDDRVPPEWPWARCWWKPKDRRSNLVRAGALIAAELDRMDREGAANA